MLTPATGVHEGPGEPKLLDYKSVSAQNDTVEFATSQLTTQSQAEVILQRDTKDADSEVDKD